MTSVSRKRVIHPGCVADHLAREVVAARDEQGGRRWAAAGASVPTEANSGGRRTAGTNRLGRASTPSTPEEVVAHKVKQFARDRRAILLAMARRKNIEVPKDAELFFRRN